MKRTTVAPLAVGAVAGAVAVAFWLGGSTGRGITGLGDALNPGLPALAGGESGRTSEIPTVADRLVAYREAQAETDTEAILRRLDAAAGLPESVGRDLELDALLARLAEIDPGMAFQMAGSFGLDSAFIIDTLVLWAEQDAEAALAALTDVEPAGLRTEAALALIELIGGDDAGIGRIASALRPADRDEFLVAWLARRAEDDPFGSLGVAARIGSSEVRQRALAGVAAAWVATDPYSALAQADSLDRQRAAEFQSAVFQQWARLDSEGFAQYVESQADLPDELSAGLAYLLAGNPERALGLLEGASGTMAESMQQAALVVLASVDPDAAMTRLASAPPGRDRDRLLSGIAHALTQRDPQQALDWALGLDPPSPEALQSVAMAIAQTDFSLALSLLEDPEFRVDSSLILSLASSVVSREPEQAASAANQLLELGNLQGRNALQNLLANWMQVDTAAALDWVIAHEADVDVESVRNAARNFAQRDPVAAVAMTNRMPKRFESAWVEQVAGAYAAYDPDAARTWIEAYRGTEVHEAATREIILRSAQVDPSAAAAMLQQSSAETQRAAALAVAENLAGTEPLAAANWAIDLRDPEARSYATGSVVRVWSATDYRAARNWAVNLRDDQLRDDALRSLLQQSAARGDFDLDLLDRFSTATVRDMTLMTVIPVLARSNPGQAEDILDREIASAGLRDLLREGLPQPTSGESLVR